MCDAYRAPVGVMAASDAWTPGRPGPRAAASRRRGASGPALRCRFAPGAPRTANSLAETRRGAKRASRLVYESMEVIWAELSS